MNVNITKCPRARRKRIGGMLMACASLLIITKSSSAFQFGEGDWSGSFDTTVSFGGLYRLKGPDPHYYGRANCGLQ